MKYTRFKTPGLAPSLALVGLLLAPAVGHAAVISWGAAQDTTATTDVLTAGALVSAHAEGSTSVSSTVNGVTFQKANSLGSAAGGLLAGATTGDTEFDRLLNNVSYGGGSGTTTIDLGAFTIGKTYYVQVFYTDQRSATNDRVMRYGSSTGGGTVDLDPDPNNLTSSPWGQFAIGTFTADGTDPDLTLTPQGFGNSHISAWQVREVPEPSSISVLLLGLGGLGLLIRRRR